MKLRINPIKQTKGYCGPASLKMIMDSFGIRKSQDYWAKQTKTSRNTGCSEKEIVRVAKSLGFRSYIKQKSTLNELKDLLSRET
jgi:ABC-type bacteriocin/lantibiotic exporter with double-glycine peptidase domain